MNTSRPSQVDRALALALVQALQMWSNERYRAFLLTSKPGPLTEEWFRWFVGSWNVARTIRDGCQGRVREYFDSELRSALLRGGGAQAVDAAARHLQVMGWSSRTGKNGKSSLPISLVSKCGFFLCPATLVPYDRYAKDGLRALQREQKLPRVTGESYAEYLDAFDQQFARMESQLNAALLQPWVAALAEKLGCPAAALKTVAMRRKLFDDYLMHSGGYLKG